MQGQVKLLLTGKLGDVMQNPPSGHELRPLARSQFELRPDFYRQFDIHVHIPREPLPRMAPRRGSPSPLQVASALTKIPCDAGRSGQASGR